MAMLDDVRARVQAAAERHIQQRSDQAAAVAEAWQTVLDRRAALDAATAAMDDAVKSALSVLSVDELAEFTDIRKTELRAHTGTRTSRQRSARRSGKTTPANKAPAAPVDSDSGAERASD